MSYYAITGIPVESGASIPNRLEITSFVNDNAKQIQVSLFIRALTAFQQMDVTDLKSFFQVAGIHGFPQVSWDGEPKKGTKPAYGFCNHNLITFPTWHRPYMLLFEQRLWEIMIQYVKTSVPADQQKLWTAEANQWRLPYWDWSLPQLYIGKYGVPEICTKETVTIVEPAQNGKPPGTITVSNPLWKFSNPVGIPMGDPAMGANAVGDADGAPWSKCTATSRYGVNVNQDPSVWTNGIENWNEVNAALQNPVWYADNLGSLSEAVYRLYTDNYTKSWETFSSTSYVNQGIPGSEWLSLEYIHNNIHNWTGGFDLSACGQMSSIPVAAFDPIFYLHHGYIDRQLAIWQTLNPDKWFDNSLKTDPTPTDPLLPFHYDQAGDLYDSNKVRYWSTLGYQYEIVKGVIDEKGKVDQHALAQLKVKLAATYGHLRRVLRSIPELHGKENDYILNIIYDRYALNGRPYTIHFFLGHPPTELEAVSQFHKHPSHIGIVYTFSTEITGEDDSEPHCVNCAKQKKAGVLSRAQLHLTSPLIKHALDPERTDITDIARRHIDEYLHHRLHWRAVDISGQVLDITAHLPRTKIFAMAGIGHHEGDTSRYGSYQHIWRATQGKPGGASEADREHLGVIVEH